MIDLVPIKIVPGDGGSGASSFRREKFVPFGGPDGGDGGRGGAVILVSDEGLTTLAHLRHRQVYRAENGKRGQGGHRHGGNGKDVVIKVPVGTIATIDGGEFHWDLDRAGARVVAASGGSGGRGNARFANSIRQAPNFAEKGLPGEALDVRLELKLLADVGLVGLPNAGKSTLLRAVSRAMPDVAPFPFTTLEPVLGVVDLGLEAFVMADLPGLIEGAHEGAGLGLEFLKHVERTRILVHMLDASAPDPLADYQTIRRELELYNVQLVEKREVVVFNKIDLPEARETAAVLKDRLPGSEVMEISGATGEGTQALIKHLQQLIQELAIKLPLGPETAELPVLRPEPRDRLEVEAQDGVFIIRGKKAEQDAIKLGEGGYDALDELQGRLGRMGLSRAMRQAGASPGDHMRVGAVDLEWHG